MDRPGGFGLRCLLGGVAAVGLLAGCGDSGAGPPPPPPPPANRAPQAQGSIPDQALKLDGNAATVDVAGNFSDPDDDALTYAVAWSLAGVAAASVSGSVVTVRPVGPGIAIATVTARDPGGLTATLSFRVTVAALPDLVVGVSPDSVAVAPGGSVRLTVTIRNHGGVAAATRVRTFESADSVITTSDNEIGMPADVPALGAGESARGRVTVTVRGSASPGTVLYLGQCADAVQGESNTGNNCSNAVAIVVRAPDGDVGAAGQSRSARPDSAAAAVERIDRSRFFIRKEGDR